MGCPKMSKIARGAKRNKLGNFWVFVQPIWTNQDNKTSCTKTQTLPDLFLFAPLAKMAGKVTTLSKVLIS